MTSDNNPPPVRARQSGRPADRGYGILLMIGIFVGLAVGLFLDQPSAGTMIGLGLAGLAAIGLRLAGR